MEIEKPDDEPTAEDEPETPDLTKPQDEPPLTVVTTPDDEDEPEPALPTG
jgi:hypothetical protein